MPDYLTVVYAYLPLTLAANLTHYIPAAMTEAGKFSPSPPAPLASAEQASHPHLEYGCGGLSPGGDAAVGAGL
jgi:hypothetical protein